MAEVKEYESDGTTHKEYEYKEIESGSTNAAPYLVEMELRMLDSRESFLKWKNAGDEQTRIDVFTENGYTFRRAVLLGKKGNDFYD